MKRIIFHLPFKVLTEYPSASQLRPLKMLQAFKNIGCEVDLVAGYGDERKAMIQEVKENIKKGMVYDFLYSESYNMPNLLSEPNHIPKFPFLDSRFFAFCKKRNIPIGLFYRDVHWNFPHYRQNFGLKTLLLTYPFYIYDLFIYKKYVDVIYLPSVGMKDYIPVNLKADIQPLPPGIDIEELGKSFEDDKPENGILKVLYVGGIGNLYQIESLFKAVATNPQVHLRICCREAEWNAVSSIYGHFLNDNVKVVHKKGKELNDLYEWADIASIFVKPIEYWKIVMPMKLFEYMKFEKAVIGVKGTAVGEFIEENKIGWSMDYNADNLANTFREIIQNPQLIQDKKRNIKEIIGMHTWEKRAEKVVNDLTTKN